MISKKIPALFCIIICIISIAIHTQYCEGTSLETTPVSVSNELHKSTILINQKMVANCIPCQNKFVDNNMIVQAPDIERDSSSAIKNPVVNSTSVISEIGSSDVSIESGGYYIGVFRNAQWYADVNANHIWDGSSVDRTTKFGYSTDIPVSTYYFGVFRNGVWYLDTNTNGRWDGPSVDRQTGFGLAGDIPVYGLYRGGTSIYSYPISCSKGKH